MPTILRHRLASRVKHPFALQIDDLARLVEGEIHRIVVGGVGVGADEAVLLAHAVALALDDTRGLIGAAVFVRRGADGVALVLDGVRDLRDIGAAFRTRPEQRAPGSMRL